MKQKEKWSIDRWSSKNKNYDETNMRYSWLEGFHFCKQQILEELSTKPLNQLIQYIENLGEEEV